MNNNSTMMALTLGFIFIIAMIIGVYVVVTQPNGGAEGTPSATPSSNDEPSAEAAVTTDAAGDTSTAGGFTLSSKQVEALTSLGIDAADIPESISAEQEACFVSTLGAPRVDEIKAGAVPSAMEFFQAKSCI